MRAATGGFALSLVLMATLTLTALLTTTTGLVHLDARLGAYAADQLHARAAADAVATLVQDAWLEAGARGVAEKGWTPLLPEGLPWDVEVSTARPLESGDFELDYVVQVRRARLVRWLRLRMPAHVP